MNFKDSTNTKACCNCKHCIRTKIDDTHIQCNCDIDGHYQGYLEVMGLRCELWELENESKTI